MLYYLHEMHRLSMAPARLAAEVTKSLLKNPLNPIATTYLGRMMGSAAEIFELQTRRYGRPDWALDKITIDQKPVSVEIETALKRTWCQLLHFRRNVIHDDPRVLLVAPYSGHFATLLRGTVERLLPSHDIYITDWEDARMVPYGEDRFNFFDYNARPLDQLYKGPLAPLEGNANH